MNDPGETPPPNVPEEPTADTAQDEAPPPVTPATTVPAVPVTPDPGPPPAVDPFPSGYTNEGVPTLDYVRDKIEGRWATSVGTAELAEESAAGRDIAEQEAERAKKAKEKLDEIRRSLGGG